MGHATIATALLLALAHIDTAGPGITIKGATVAEAAILMRTVNRYTAAGLELPEFVATFSTDCRFSGGRYAYRSGILKICRPYPDDPRWPDKLDILAVHELAHAWDAHNLTPADREAWMAGERLTGDYFAPDARHSDRPVEILGRQVMDYLDGKGELPTIEGATPTEAAVIEAGVDLYRDSNLGLPSLTVRVTDADECHGAGMRRGTPRTARRRRCW